MDIGRVEDVVRQTDSGDDAVSVPLYAVMLTLNVLLMGGAILVASIASPASMRPLFAAFLVSHLCLAAHALRIRYTILTALSMWLGLLDLYLIAVRI